MKNLILLILFTFSIVSCGKKEQFFDTMMGDSDKITASESMEGGIFANPFGGVDLQRFCGNQHEGKTAFHSGKIQENFDCEPVLYFTIVEGFFCKYADKDYQIEQIEKGIKVGLLLTKRQKDIYYTDDETVADVNFLWADKGQTVPPVDAVMGDALAYATLPTEEVENGHIYLKNSIIDFDKLPEIIGHEFGHFLGYRHRKLLDFGLMNPFALYVTKKPVLDETTAGNFYYPICEP